jgi:DNA helicase HerA-like ATPase
MTARGYSIDGVTFAFDAPLNEAIPIGSYVTIATEDHEIYLGQVLASTIGASERGSDESGSVRSVSGRGNLLSRLSDRASQSLDTTAVFGDGVFTAAEPGIVAAHLASSFGSTSAVELGQLQRPVEVSAQLHAKGFGRHTFLCGQSGSGKTYTLGVILERLLLDTDIRMVVIDPNSDYVNLGSVRSREATGFAEDEYRALVDRYQTVSPRVHVFGGEGSDKRLQALFGRLSFQQQSMVLGLDPIDDAEEYNAFVRIVRRLDTEDYSLADVMTMIRSSFDDDDRRLGLRIDNLGIQDQTIWAGDEPAVMSHLPSDWRMLVADTGSLPSSAEASIAAAALLTFLWDRRRDREPMIIVIDEAHNVCPQDPIDANQALATETVVRIAGEGRKFGLYLLLATQRPSKVHQNVISQCDNLLLMKMNSASDLRSLSETFSYAPPGLVGLAAGFGLGEGLAAGKIAPDPLLFRSGRRLSVEGGSDVPSGWARVR